MCRSESTRTGRPDLALAGGVHGARESGDELQDQSTGFETSSTVRESAPGIVEAGPAFLVSRLVDEPRRGSGPAARSPRLLSGDVIRFADCELDLDRIVLRRGGEEIRIEPQVFDVLAYLVEHRGVVVRKEDYLDAIWGDRFVSESRLTTRDQGCPPGRRGRPNHRQATNSSRSSRKVRPRPQCHPAGPSLGVRVQPSIGRGAFGSLPINGCTRTPIDGPSRWVHCRVGPTLLDLLDDATNS